MSPSDKNVCKNSELVNPRKQHRKKQKLLSLFACRNIFVCFNSYYFLNWQELVVLPHFQIWVLTQWMFLVNSRYICHLKTVVLFYWSAWTWRNVSFFHPPSLIVKIPINEGQEESMYGFKKRKKKWTFTGDNGTGEWSSYLQGYVGNSHRIFIPGMRKHNNNYYYVNNIFI